MPLRTTLWFYAALAAVISITSSSPAAKAPQAVTVDAILTSPWLWGRDFNGARPHLRTWTEIGEQTLDIFPSRIDGHTPIKKTADAAAAASQLSRALDRSLAAHALTPGSIRFRTTVVTSSDDDFPRVAWTDGSLEFLRPELTIREVIERLGPAERKSELVIEGEGDRRPVVLTLHSYAGGAVSFAESDVASQPGLVDRVLLNVSNGAGGAVPEPPRVLGASASSARQTSRASTGDLTVVDIATDETDPRNLGDTEPSIAVNPTNPLEIAVVSFSERWSSTAQAPVWKSSDGGTTWRKVFQIPQPVPGSSGPGDQKIAFDADGRLYVAELGGGDFIFRQESDDPDDWLVPGARYGNDQPHLAIDGTDGSPCFGQVYTPWLNFGIRPERSTISASSDRGETLSDIGAGDNSQFPNRTSRIAIAPSGKAYVIYKTREGAVAGGFERAHFRVMRSDDCGETWNGLGDGGVSIHGDDQVVTWFTSSWGIPGPGRKVARARSSDGWIATSAASESVYAVYVNRTDTDFGQIFLARSDDEGETWTGSQVTDDTHHAAYPEIAVADKGVVGVLYVDYEDTGDATIFRHHFATSFDGGTTWTDEILQGMNPYPIANASNGFLWGDYEGLTALGDAFYGVFTGESIGRSVTQLDPIFFKRSAEPNRGIPTDSSQKQSNIR